MRNRTTSSTSNSDKKNGKKRLSGGPSVAEWVDDWWAGEADRVAEVDSLAQASIPTLLTRIAKAQLDLTSVGLERYREADRLYQQKQKAKISSS